MTENIEWGEWVEADWRVVDAETESKLCEIRFATTSNPIAYRIGTFRQPVVTTQVLYWRRGYDAGIHPITNLDTHKITITLHDGKPVGIEIEELK